MQITNRCCSQLFVCICILICGRQANGTERSTIAKGAELVVVGRLTSVQKSLESTGWRISGTVLVKEVVFGNARAQQRLHYQFVCSCCPTQPTPPIHLFTDRELIWFLTRAGVTGWKSAGMCSDPGGRR